MKRWTAALAAGWVVAAAIAVPLAGAARADAGTPKIVVIVLENKEISDIVGSASAPYMNALIPQGLQFTDYHALLKGSGPNYRAMTAGITTTPSSPPANIFRSLDLASRPWTELEESMTGNCGVTDNARVPGSPDHLYTGAHDPAHDWRGNESCATSAVPLTSDAQLTGLPDFTYIVPNQCDDMHTTPKPPTCPSYFGPVTGSNFIQMGDKWLAHVVPILLSDPDTTVIITFDEGAFNVTTQHVYTLEIGAGVAPGTPDGQHYDHYSLLAGLYRFFGLGTAPNAGTTAVPLPIAPDTSPSLGVDAEGTGSVLSNPTGIACGSGQAGPCSATFSQSALVTLTATPDSGSTFDGWGGDCSGSGTDFDCVVSMDTARNVTATFGPMFTLTVDPPTNGTVTSDVGSIDCPGTCDQDFVSGTSVTLTPHPLSGYAFEAWGGDCPDPHASTCILTMDSARSVSATFAPVPQDTLTVTTDGTGQGSVNSDVGAINCPSTCTDDFDLGQAVVLTAHVGANSVFTGWSGACAGSAMTCTVTMDAPESATATFDTAPAVQTLDDGDPAVVYNGWSDVADPGAMGGAYRVSHVAKDKAMWKSAKTTSLTWTSHEGPAGGMAAVTIDGEAKGTVDLYAPSGGQRSVTFSGLTAKVHTVTVTITGAKNASSVGTEVGIDSFSSGGASTPDSDPSIKYDAWVGTASAHALGGSYRSSAAKSATLTLSFTGTEIDWITSKGPAFGRASVSIDGTAMGTVDLYRASQTWQATIAYAGLSAGPHTLVIRVLAQKAAASKGTKVVVDGFRIQS